MSETLQEIPKVAACIKAALERERDDLRARLAASEARERVLRRVLKKVQVTLPEAVFRDLCGEIRAVLAAPAGDALASGVQEAEVIADLRQRLVKAKRANEVYSGLLEESRVRAETMRESIAVVVEESIGRWRPGMTARQLIPLLAAAIRALPATPVEEARK